MLLNKLFFFLTCFFFFPYFSQDMVCIYKALVTLSLQKDSAITLKYRGKLAQSLKHHL